MIGFGINGAVDDSDDSGDAVIDAGDDCGVAVSTMIHCANTCAMSSSLRCRAPTGIAKLVVSDCICVDARVRARIRDTALFVWYRLCLV